MANAKTWIEGPWTRDATIFFIDRSRTIWSGLRQVNEVGKNHRCLVTAREGKAIEGGVVCSCNLTLDAAMEINAEITCLRD